MHLHLRLALDEEGVGTCPNCSRDNEALFSICVTKGTTVESTDGYCLGCLTQCEVPLIIMEQEATTGRPLSAKAIRRRSQRQERELAEATGARQQKASGSLPWAKGDVRLRGSFLAECKFTRAKSYSMKLQDLNKIRGECSSDEVPVLDVTFTDNNGRRDDRWVAMPYEVWLKLFNQK